MSKQFKYKMSGGLVLSEEKDMNKLSKLATEGWILESFEKLSYKLRKDEPEDVVYCVDFNEDKDDEKSYLELFENTPWEYVCSCEGYYFFKAPVGTKPIYTDKTSKSLKYEVLYKSIKKEIVVILAIVVLCMIGAHFSESIFINSIWMKIFRMGLYIVAGGGLGLTVSLLICAIKAYKNIVK